MRYSALCLAWVAFASLPALAQQNAAQTRPQNQATNQGAAANYSNYFGTPLYSNPDVQRSLSLTQQQLNRLNEANATLQSRFQTDFGRLPSLAEQQREARRQELLRDYNSEMIRSSSGILSADQLTRYRQLYYQNQGFNAFTDPAVARDLNLSEDQLRQIRAMGEQNDRTMRELRDAARANREDAMRRYDEYRRQSQQQLNSLLNDQQRQAWSKMTGEPFTFQPSFINPDR